MKRFVLFFILFFAFCITYPHLSIAEEVKFIDFADFDDEDESGEDIDYTENDDFKIDDGDPLEGMNRAIFYFSGAFNKALIRPAGIVYRDYMPEFIQDTVGNLYDYIRSPITIVNSILQGDEIRFRDSVGRFLVNTLFGLCGVFDVASEIGIPKYEEDFGQTLAVWGVGTGPYLFLPFLGPSNARDGVGKIVDIFLDPFRIFAEDADVENEYFLAAMTGKFDGYSSMIAMMDKLEASSLDYYVTLRTFYTQNREASVKNIKYQEPYVPYP